jgi:hypothetical protein
VGNDQGMSSPDEDLLATEGVDEGSAKSTAEGAPSTQGLSQLQNALDEPRSSRPTGESDPAPPEDMESAQSRAARQERGTGQQLQAGEG